MESGDVKRINKAMETLQNALHEVSTRMYSQQQGTPPGGMGGNQGGPEKTQDEKEQEQFRKASSEDDSVVDADYE